jgi:hypothetical protein
MLRIPNEDVGQDETLSEVIAVLETNDYNSNIENIVEEVYTAVNNEISHYMQGF